jgi:hypothetical protein
MVISSCVPTGCHGAADGEASIYAAEVVVS